MNASAAQSTSEQGSSTGQQSGERASPAEGSKEFYDELEAYISEHGSERLLEELAKQPPRLRKEDFPVTGGRNRGYTPFEYITFTDELIEHTLSIQVDAPVSKVYRVWANRINYNEWFDLIGQVVLHTEDPEYASYFLFYKWGQLPTLELYVTLQRTAVENDYILERAVDGMDLSVGAYFREKEGGTEVSLRVAYLLPEQLHQYVGPVGVWGDVNDILQENLDMMKVFVEAVDADELDKVRALDTQVMDQGVADTNEALDVLKQQLIDEGVRPGEGSPEARAEMEKVLGEMGINLDDYPDDYADNYDATKQMMQQAPAQPQPSQARQEPPAATGTEDKQRRSRAPKRAPAKAVAPSGVREPAEAKKKRGPQASNAITKEALLAFSGKPQTEAAKAFGVSASTISKYAREYGITWRKTVAGNKRMEEKRQSEPGAGAGKQ
ncbi:hypothetical protein COCSUDRAFT_60416 [Coccomyxa subellipsoidea C-169]|uniref:Uncharacterized protein n=1 Tax=Coccomyxa subellipsoidea (strain C-169) TaxID=574566 RepID=I0YIJ6_COCSC|nr:hypothetical protein COCSUDRAFT_60416 [Coccomyxa subellipsoidea C-169]EIE18215.1 hypothetical protein COCSUDRAFT_60416 [Coccomyxa subellipsoidea C-169]|eukprot:XP_005642759.1 hypothetical protein COCSUDRAFT_60416 [Coccomyxa subellipsoidea C-169]